MKSLIVQILYVLFLCLRPVAVSLFRLKTLHSHILSRSLSCTCLFRTSYVEFDNCHRYILSYVNTSTKSQYERLQILKMLLSNILYNETLVLFCYFYFPIVFSILLKLVGKVTWIT